MLTSMASSLLVLGAFAFLAKAQIGPDPHWTNPDGEYPDFTTKFVPGQKVLFTWLGLNDSMSDLWLTTAEPTRYSFNQSIYRNVNISIPGQLSYTVDISPTVLNQTNKFTLRFFPAGAEYGILQFQQQISPGFIINSTAGAVASSPSSTTISSTSRTSTASSTGTASSTLSTSTTTNAASTTATTNPTSTPASESSNGLTVGAQAGIGVGVGLGVVALLVIGCWFGRKYRVSRRPPSYSNVPPAEVEPRQQWSHEAPASDVQKTAWTFSRPPRTPEKVEIDGTPQAQELPTFSNEKSTRSELV